MQNGFIQKVVAVSYQLTQVHQDTSNVYHQQIKELSQTHPRLQHRLQIHGSKRCTKSSNRSTHYKIEAEKTAVNCCFTTSISLSFVKKVEAELKFKIDNPLSYPWQRPCDAPETT
jgi:hypothetical protein